MIEWFENLSEAWQIAIFGVGSTIAIAVVSGLLALVKWLSSKKLAKPGIQEGRVTLPIKSAHNRYPHGNIIVTNSGERVCYIKDLNILWKGGIDFEVNIRSFEEKRIKGLNPGGVELLPIQPR